MAKAATSESSSQVSPIGSHPPENQPGSEQKNRLENQSDPNFYSRKLSQQGFIKWISATHIPWAVHPSASGLRRQWRRLRPCAGAKGSARTPSRLKKRTDEDVASRVTDGFAMSGSHVLSVWVSSINSSFSFRISLHLHLYYLWFCVPVRVSLFSVSFSLPVRK